MAVPADNFVETVRANVDNEKLTDEEFRAFIRNTLPIVEDFATNQYGVRVPVTVQRREWPNDR